MRDRYKNFEQLRASESEGAFDITIEERSSEFVVVAPHGGGIEPGTSEIARAIAGDDLSYYLFEGRKRSGNKALHITSTRFDEPTGLALIRRANRVLTVHGERGKSEIVYLGGLDHEFNNALRAALETGGYSARKHRDRGLQGLNAQNICNAGRTGAGVQLELTDGLRRSFFESLSRMGRRRPLERLAEFSSIVRKVMLGNKSEEGLRRGKIKGDFTLPKEVADQWRRSVASKSVNLADAQPFP